MSEVRELYGEEADQLARSSKKIKPSGPEHGAGGGESSNPPTRLSFRDAMIGAKSPAIGNLRHSIDRTRDASGSEEKKNGRKEESDAGSDAKTKETKKEENSDNEVLSHKISTPPACWLGESKFSSGQLSTQSSAKNTVESRSARCCQRHDIIKRRDALVTGERFQRLVETSFRPLAYWDSSLRALPALSNNEFRLGPGKCWQQQKGRGPCNYCVRPSS
ncbi:hypothetical protein COLO4_07960 [Corchorus olitorius]|uniref:Uncharacterized protein n=1 Tax=Corchorus olitorius TaxID=93759 RepID=A0A1R3KI24_9ROSI|nr:hypothetical protein COLO4_07960 [Corchorus olitorius]